MLRTGVERAVALVYFTTIPLYLGALCPIAEGMLALMSPGLDDLHHPHPLILAAVVDSRLDRVDLAPFLQRQCTRDLEELVCLYMMDGRLNRPWWRLLVCIQQTLIVCLLLISKPLFPLILSLV